jgi:hypothetical protein
MRSGGSKKGFWQKVNEAFTEVDTQYFDDDTDWDQRVKLPQWQLSGLKERYARRQKLRKNEGKNKKPR